MPCCRQISATESPFSACFKIDRICGSEYLLGFINISSFIKPEKILRIKPIIFRGDYQFADEAFDATRTGRCDPGSLD